MYVVTGLPLGLIWGVVMLGGLATGLGLSFLLFGIPLLAAIGVARLGSNTERVRAALVLGSPIDRPPRPIARGKFLARWRTRLSDRALWKEVGYMLALGPVGVISGTLTIAL